jgi:cyclopropane fatty-acyl-phospholipid synthase-like methyltransferase
MTAASLAATSASDATRSDDPGPCGTVHTAEAVTTCYEVLDLCRGCGISDFTDGVYLDDRNSRGGYLAAQRRQAEYLLDQIDCDLESRILDIGCGYGRILAAAMCRGAEAIGLTVSPPQVAAGLENGLDVRLCNYREIPHRPEFADWRHSFDGIVANGSLEHFVQVEDAAAGRADDIYGEFFHICRDLLRPGGKLVTTAIHARRAGQVNPHDLLQGAERWPRGSVNYHAANLHRSFGGWYPEPGQLERCAAGSFELVAAEDGTHDYLLTSEYWMRRIRLSLALDPRSWPRVIAALRRRPRETRQMLQCLLVDESWTYQFRDPAPAQLWRQTWIAI